MFWYCMRLLRLKSLINVIISNKTINIKICSTLYVGHVFTTYTFGCIYKKNLNDSFTHYRYLLYILCLFNAFCIKT